MPSPDLSPRRPATLETLRPAERLALRAVDAAITAAVFAVPFLLGGTKPPGHLVLIVTSVSAAAGWFVFCCLRPQTVVRWTGAEPLIALGLLVAALQIVPLPAEVIETLSPTTGRLLAGWSEAGGAAAPGGWRYLSLSPYATRSELLLWVCYALLFLTTAQRLRGVADVERMLRTVACAAIAMAALSLAQLFAGNGKFLWLYENAFVTTGGVTKGSFINRNHFAQFLALGLGPLIWWQLRMLSNDRRDDEEFTAGRRRGGTAAGVLAVAIGAVVFAALLSQSRGGAAACLVAAGTFVGILCAKRMVSRQLVVTLGCVGAVLGGLLATYGYEAVSKRLDNWEFADRVYLWRVNGRVLADFPLFGTGLGSHRDAYQLHFDAPSNGKTYVHAESSYVQTVSETGVVGSAVTVLTVLLAVSWCVRGLRSSPSRRHTLALLATTAGLAANLLHAAGDFLWSVPGLMAVVVVLAASAWRLFDLTRRRPTAEGSPQPHSFRLPGLAWAGCLLGVLAGGGWMAYDRLPSCAAWPHVEHYRRLCHLDRHQDRPPEELTREKLAALRAAASADPRDPHIALELASAHLVCFTLGQLQGENVMGLEEVGQVARDPAFGTAGQRGEWLRRALGENLDHLHAAADHSRRAVQGCPLLGEAFLSLASLDFLDPSADGEALVRQALAVRPYDDRVLFAAGQRAFAAGDVEGGIDLWNRASRLDPRREKDILEMLADTVPARMLLDRFRLSRAGLRFLHARLKAAGHAEDSLLVLNRLAETAVREAGQVSGEDRAAALLEAFQAYDALGREPEARRCLRAAVQTTPEWFAARRAAAHWHFAHQDYAEAAGHVNWCLLRRPDDPALLKMQRECSIDPGQPPRNESAIGPAIGPAVGPVTIRE